MPHDTGTDVAPRGTWSDEEVRAPARSGVGPLLGELGSEHTRAELARYAEEVAPHRDEVLRLHGSGDLRLYERLLRDDQVHTTFQQRRTAVIANPLRVDAGGDSPIDELAADDLREQLQALSFDRITYRMLAGLMYGYAVGECMFEPEGLHIRLANIRVRQARRFRFAINGNLIMVSPEQRTMPPNKFWVFTCGADDDDNLHGQGLGHWLYWPVWFKRNADRFWALWLEKFASPTPTARGPAGMTDSEEQKLLDLLKAVTTGGRIVIPKGVEIELLEAARQAGGDFNLFVDKMDAAIAKIVVSQTMTTDDGSSLGQAKVHLDVQRAVVRSDAELVCESFNSGPARWLTEWNWPGAKTPIVYRDSEESEDLKLRAERDSIIASWGYRPTPEYVAETYGDGFVDAAATPATTPSEPAPTPTGETA